MEYVLGQIVPSRKYLALHAEHCPGPVQIVHPSSHSIKIFLLSISLNNNIRLQNPLSL